MKYNVNPSAVKLVAFDAFDTIVHYKKHPESHKKGAYSFLLENTGLTKEELKHRTRKMMTKNSNFADMADEISRTYRHLTPQRIEQIFHILQDELKSICFYDDTFSTLKYLKDAGYKLGLISNLAHPYGEHMRRQLGDFDTVGYSYEIGYQKPDKEIFQRMADQNSIALSEILMIGNHPKHDFSAPRQHGTQSLLLDRNYAEISIPEKDKIASLAELKDILT